MPYSNKVLDHYNNPRNVGSFDKADVNVGTGIHTLKVQARASSASSGANGGVAISNALYGLGSLTVESVRLVNSFSF